MKLFPRTHLERAARLTLLRMVAEPDGDPELAISRSVSVVANEAEPVYPRYTVLEVAAHAIHLYAAAPPDDRTATQIAEQAFADIADGK